MERANGHESGFVLQPGRRQYVKYTFYRAEPGWRRQDPPARERQIAEFVDVVEGWQRRTMVRCFSTAGVRGDVDFMVWQVSYELDDIQEMAGDLLGTELGGWLTTPYAYLAMTKHSTYVEKYAGPTGDRSTRLSLAPGNAKYLFVYPMTKVREWYGLGPADRQEAMNQHIAVGATYPSVKINTTYSFGLDDQEFVVAFESDEPADFLDLVQELRGSISSAYTASDVPVFTCRATTAEGMLRAMARFRTPALA